MNVGSMPLLVLASQWKGNPMKPHSKNALTIVEVFVLLAVLGILAAILIPTAGRVHDCGGRTNDASNIRQIAQASLIRTITVESCPD